MESPQVTSSSKLLNSREIGKGGKPPPPSSPHNKDTISEDQSNQGVIGYVFSFVSGFFNVLLDGLGVVYSWARWPFEWIGILSPTKAEDKPTGVSLEQQMNRLEEAFKGKSHSERLRLLAYEVALLEGTDVDSFFTKLFKQQNEKVLKALTDVLAPGFHDVGHDAVKEGLPRLLYQAFSKKPEDCTPSEIKLVETYRKFMLGFPDYVLAYVDMCFSPSAPSSHRFDALRILCEYEGPQEKYQSLDLDTAALLKTLKEALPKYYKKLSSEEKDKVLCWMGSHVMGSAMDRLKMNILKKKSDSQMLQIFKDHKVDETDLVEKSIAYTLTDLMDEPKQWPPIQAAIFEQFPSIGEDFEKARDEVFLSASKEDRSDWCKLAFEAELDIFKMRLATIAAGGDEQLVEMANTSILDCNEAHAIALFRAYRDVMVTKMVRDTSVEVVRAESEFLANWYSCISIDSDPRNDRITDHGSFCSRMHDIETTQEYRDAASAIIKSMEARD